ncbi:hypothetical protein B0H11DRAFT_1962712 [Mycena galericulata]|nr:hypothetical protein B0H11DRAFT_1962712 [Mycena galericulata]
MATAVLEGSGPASVPDASFERLCHFPPFPGVPDGVKITPFKDFQEWGTRVVGADKVERDGLGIPTIPLPKKKAEKKAEMAALGSKGTWWAVWEASGEKLITRGPYDPTLNRVDRLHRAAEDFQRYHNVNIHKNVQMLWNKFQSYIGLGPNAKVAADDDELSDDEFDAELVNAIGNQGAATTSEAAPPITSPDPDAKPEDDKIARFLNDPELSIRIFLSSYMRAEGLMWHPHKLVSAPHLLRFFVEFLLRNAVLPENVVGLRKALDVIAIAGNELPLIPVVSNALPDSFSAACTGCWGRKTQMYLDDDEDGDSIAGQPEAKRFKSSHEATDAEGDAAFEEARIEEVKGDNGVIDDASQDVDMNAAGVGNVVSGWGAMSVQLAPDANDTAVGDGWGSGSGWGAGGGSATGTWGHISTPNANTNDVAGSGDAKPAENSDGVPAAATLLSFFDSINLPLTHQPGVVEASLRRIKSIAAPPNNLAKAQSGAEAVERELEGRMYRVVLTPWLDWENPETAMPRILPSSSGAIVVPGQPAAAATSGSSSQLKPHDMMVDDITILVDPAEADKLRVGMGLGGTWVQLARLQDGKDASLQAEIPQVTKKNLTKGQKEKLRLRYWYIEELLLILPSYWSV